MITEIEIYLIVMLDKIVAMFGVLLAFTIFWIIINCLSILFEKDNFYPDKNVIEGHKKNIFRAIPFAICLTLALVFIPTTRQMAMIKVIPAIANSELVGEMSVDTKELYRMGIDTIKERLQSKEQSK